MFNKLCSTFVRFELSNKVQSNIPPVLIFSPTAPLPNNKGYPPSRGNNGPPAHGLSRDPPNMGHKEGELTLSKVMLVNDG
jgi:hypothetical protein